jgi:hypothetical protein
VIAALERAAGLLDHDEPEVERARPCPEQAAGGDEMLAGPLRLAVVEQVLGVEQVRVRERDVVVHQLVDGQGAVGVGDRLTDLAGGRVQP